MWCTATNCIKHTQQLSGDTFTVGADRVDVLGYIYKPNIAINWLVCTLCGTVNVCGAWNGNNCYALLYRYHEMSSYRGYATLKGQIRCSITDLRKWYWYIRCVPHCSHKGWTGERWAPQMQYDNQPSRQPQMNYTTINHQDNLRWTIKQSTIETS